MDKRVLLLGLPVMLLGMQQAGAVSFGTFDPRSMAMGGTGVASGTSANASFFNPALLAAGRDGEDFSLEFPVLGLRVADPDEMIDSLDDFQSADYITKFSDAVDQWNAATTVGELLTAKDAVVNRGRDLTAGLATLSNKAVQGELNVGAVVGVPSKRFGASVYVNARAIGGSLLAITQSDLNNVNAVIDGLDTNNFSGIVDGSGNLIDPTDNLTSSVRGRGVVLSEVGVSLAREFDFGGHPVAIGVTPKFVQANTFDYQVDVDTADISVDQGEKKYTDVNLDAGVLHRYANGWSTGVVAKNLIPHEYKTALGNMVKVNTQLRLGTAYEWKSFTLAADLDLMENDAAGLDGPTQYLGVGGEWNGWDWVQVRLGYRHNISDSDTSTASLGLGFSPFGVHADLAVAGNSNEVGVGFQLGFRF